jgi:hypothetical protein
LNHDPEVEANEREASPEDLQNSAFWYIQRHYHKLLKGKTYGPSVMDMIRVAPDAEELKLFLEKVWPGAKAQTRRRWARAAEIRYRELAA